MSNTAGGMVGGTRKKVFSVLKTVFLFALLLVYMTVFAGLDQHLAQGINLLYFLPAGLMALPAHLKNGYVVKPVLLPAIGAGLALAALAAWAATALDVEVLRKCFGAFLIIVGTMEFFGKARE